MNLAVLEGYGSYEESGIEWIGDTPAHWDVRRAKEVFEISRGRVIAKTELVDDGKFPVYSSQTKNDGCLGFINTFDYDGTYITWTTDGVNAGTVFLRKGKFNCTNICGTLKLKVKQNDMAYLLYALEVCTKHNKRIDTNGAKIMSNEMMFIKISIPPIDEQQAIANYLDTKTAQIDRKIELLSQKAEKYGKLKQSLINETVTRGLDQSVPMKESGIEWIGDVPAHWNITRNKDIFEERGSLSVSGEETLLTVSHITGVTRRTEKNVNMFMAETMEGYKHCKSGDLLINTMWAWMGALGTAKEDGICSPAYGVYKPKKKQSYNHRYFDYLYRTPNAITEMTRNSKGIVSSRLRLYPKDFFQILTALPSEEEQAAIADYLNERTVKIDRIIETVNSQINNLKELRKTLINDVVTGKIKVVE